MMVLIFTSGDVADKFVLLSRMVNSTSSNQMPLIKCGINALNRGANGTVEENRLQHVGETV
jgi:hypothetical protein